MAFSILILKIHEEPEKCIYAFGLNEENMGELEINKKDGTLQLKQLEIPNSQAFFKRAAAKGAAEKVYKHWKNNEFPQRTAWAS